jgi:predicted CXXCH cytochrome family protein
MAKQAGMVLLWSLFALLVHGVMVAQVTGIKGSMHDLSVSGPGPVKAARETQSCIFCHAPHNVNPTVPLWNHKLSTVSPYTLYSSSTYVQTNGQSISPRSKLCLSCHDGTVAMGQTVANGLIATTASPVAADILGTNLATDHPFGFLMPAVDDGEIKLSLMASPPTSSDPTVKFYDNTIECVTCHEPHTPGRDTAVQFMVRSNTSSALCLACHDPSRGVLGGWNMGSHATATNTVAFGSALPYTDPATVSTNACASCHAGHNSAGTGARLLRGVEASACSACHGGAANVTPGLLNVMSELNKTYAHPVQASITPPHDPAEALPVSSSRHSACSDCHNSHASQAVVGTPTPPIAEVSLNGTPGVSASDGITVLKPAVNQYEICFKCHANSNNKPQNVAYSVYGRTAYRLTYLSLVDPYNSRLNFQSSIARHNVTQPSRGGNVSPSLRVAMLDLSGSPTGRSVQGAGLYLYCTDCHNNDAARVAGGPGPNGPHGSAYEHLLERRYAFEPPPAVPGGASPGVSYVPGVTGTYALCYKCHDIDNSILRDVTFKHAEHVINDSASCATCHAPHGIQGGSSTNNLALVNFDTKVVGPSSGGVLYFQSTGINHGSCFLTCHGKDHTGLSY